MSIEKYLQVISYMYNESMEQPTNEIMDSTNPKFIIDFLDSIMHGEIANPITRHGNTLTVNLADQTVAKITAPKVARDTLPPRRTEATIENIATIRYVIQHDYGYGEEPERTELKRLELRNLDDCQVYVADACRSQLNAYYTDGLIEFFNGEKFMVAVELVK